MQSVKIHGCGHMISALYYTSQMECLLLGQTFFYLTFIPLSPLSVCLLLALLLSLLFG